MQFTLDLAVAPSLITVQRTLLEADPAALLDADPDGSRLRISTWLTRHELGELLLASGCVFPSDALVQLPSECCGGCGG